MAFLVQVVVLVPWIAISALRFTIGKQMKKNGISPDFAKTLNLQLAILLMLVYLALMQIMNLSLRLACDRFLFERALHNVRRAG